MKIFLVVVGLEELGNKKKSKDGKSVLGAFTTKAGAQALYIKTFVAPFVKKIKKEDPEKIKKYFDFNPLGKITSAQFNDILETFAQNGVIEEVNLK